ncbi:prephenate dehydratase [Natribacillus halophilus]|uniref:Prephenate dehydratase n=1 Tax=Natribacillus halophilus TaxID=549003 RepID=A0A1G8NYA0_9BACI|nr:prephenate dehydratase [Natribacillus halophilus]SDI84986.1 prephenate dehydratase [Natribacillus halophilus]
MNKVAYLGPEGTFSELAAAAFSTTAARFPYRDIASCLRALANEEVDAAAVPLENTIEGSVNITLDQLVHRHNLPIVGEVAIPIAQHLLVHPDNVDERPEAVYSHPHALAQCHDYLTEQFADSEWLHASSTAKAAQEIAADPGLKQAVVANRLAAKKYGLTIAAENIHDFANNHTRFVLLSTKGAHMEPSLETSRKKTTIVVTLPSDYSGALHQVLSAFAWRKINLSKIESRPMKTGIGHYFFIIDIDHAYDDVLVPGALEEIKALGCEIRLLGSYPSAVIEANKEMEFTF